MNSFAMWFNCVNSGETFNVDIHFNLWKMHYKEAKIPCLDIGIKIYNNAKYDSILFYVPFVLKHDEVIDLASKLKSNDILCSVFNENYHFQTAENNKMFIIKNDKDQDEMMVYCLDPQVNISVEYKFDGTIIKINRPEEMKDCRKISYYRFRIKSEKLNSLTTEYLPKNNWIESASSIVEVYDFRFNDYRSLNNSLLEELRKGTNCIFNKVHFLLMTEYETEMQYFNNSVIARQLEMTIWKDYYLTCKHNNKFVNLVAYHWKLIDGEKGIDSCIMFIKTRIPKCSWRTIIKYVLGLCLLSVLTNFIWELIKNVFD